MNQSSFAQSCHDESPLLYLPILQNSSEEPNFHELFNSNKIYYCQQEVKQQPDLEDRIILYKQPEQTEISGQSEEQPHTKQTSFINTKLMKPIYSQIKQEVVEDQAGCSPEPTKSKKLEQTLYRKIDTNTQMQIIIKDKILRLTIIQNKSQDGSDVNDILIRTPSGEIQALLDVFEVKFSQTNMGGYMKGIFYDIEALFTHIKLTNSLQFNTITHKNPIVIIESPTNTIAEPISEQEYAIDQYYLNFYVNQVLPGNRMVKRFCGLKLNKLLITEEIRQKMKVKKWRYMERNIKYMGQKLKHVVNDLDKFKDQNNQLKDKIRVLKRQLQEKERNKGRIIVPLMTEKQESMLNRTLNKSQEKMKDGLAQEMSISTQKYGSRRQTCGQIIDKLTIQREGNQKKCDQNLVKLQMIHDVMTQPRLTNEKIQEESEEQTQKNMKAEQQPENTQEEQTKKNATNSLKPSKSQQILNSPQPSKKRPKAFKSILNLHQPNKKISFATDSYEKLAELVASVAQPCQTLTIRFQVHLRQILEYRISYQQKYKLFDKVEQSNRINLENLNMRSVKVKHAIVKNLLTLVYSIYLTKYVKYFAKTAQIKNLANAIKNNANICNHVTCLTLQHSSAICLARTRRILIN